MPVLRGHEVWIETDSQRYEEYDVKVEGNVVTCYIESQVGNIFQMKWKNHIKPLEVSSKLEYKLDGVLLDQFVVNHLAGKYEAYSKGYTLDETSFKAYKFSEVKLSDGEGESLISNDFGTIVVTVHRVHVEKVAKRRSFVPLKLPDDMRTPLNERSKKLGSHRVDLDDAVQWDGMPKYYCHTHPYNGEQEPFATFRFVYRPKDILQALEIIPAIQSKGSKRVRSPSPMAGPSSSREDGRRKKLKTRLPKVKVEAVAIDLFDDEAERKLLAQQAEIFRKLGQLRKRKTSGTEKVKREVKAENLRGDSVDLSQFIIDENGAIDLTSD